MTQELRALVTCDRCGHVTDFYNVESELDVNVRLGELEWGEDDEGNDLCPTCCEEIDTHLSAPPSRAGETEC